MALMNNRRTLALSACTVLLAAASAVLCGCAVRSLGPAPLGAGPAQAAKVYPEEERLRSDVSYAQIADGLPTAHSGELLLLAKDQRVCGRFRWSYRVGPPLAPGFRGYDLDGEVDAKAAGVAELGPIDSVRVLIDDLASISSDQSAWSAHLWVVAGLLRIKARLGAGDDDALDPRLEDVMDRVRGDGSAQFRVREDGVLELGYRVGPPAKSPGTQPAPPSAPLQAAPPSDMPPAEQVPAAPPPSSAPIEIERSSDGELVPMTPVP